VTDTRSLGNGWVRDTVRQGESGGAALVDGRLVGVISGYAADGTSLIQRTEDIRGWVTDTLGYVPQCAGSKGDGVATKPPVVDPVVPAPPVPPSTPPVALSCPWPMLT